MSIVHEAQCQQCGQRAEAYEGASHDYSGYRVQDWSPPTGWYRLTKYTHRYGISQPVEADLCSPACVVAYTERPPEPDPVSRYLEETRELPF